MVSISLVLTIGLLYARSVDRIIPMTEQEAASMATDAYIHVTFVARDASL